MKKIILFTVIIFCSLLTCIMANAQVNNTEIVNVPIGTYMNIQGDLYNNSGTVNNAGTLILAGNYTNDGYFNSGSNSFVKLEGAIQQLGGINPTTFSNLVIDGTDNKQCGIDEYVEQTLQFNSNKIIIGNNNLVLLPTAIITGAANDKFVVTNGSGALIKKSVTLASDFLFPIGDAIDSYKPVILNYSGTVDTFATRVMQGVLPTTGADNDCVQYTYVVEESNTGGSDASLSLGWNTPDEGNSFNRAYAYIWQHNFSWNLIPGIPGAEPNLPATDWYYKIWGITDFSSNANEFIIKEKEATDVFIPNIFSPNDDGQNDLLFVRGEGIKEIEFVIYDRWGGKVFETSDIQQGWDGTFKGEKLSTAVFAYYVKATNYGGETVERKGNVTLIR